MNNKINKFRLVNIALLVVFFFTSTAFAMQQDEENKKKKIQIAILLDTSNSMDGLINQAKSQLWNIVNELTKAKCEGESPVLEIAIYEYGNDRLKSSGGYVRQVMPLSRDLDKISTQLFELTTNGGQEYCGTVISKSLKDLEWSKSDEDIKMIYIAGNEPFTQGLISYETACGNAREKGILVNTIHCGSFSDGVNGKWKSGALIGGGDYMSIEQDRKTVYIQTPYDDRINQLSVELNDTYIYYGSIGKVKKQEQIKADTQAESLSKSYYAKRNSVKASSYYVNDSWDLVDASDKKDFDISEVDKKTLPKNLQNKSNAEIEKEIAKMKEKRGKIKTQIRVLNEAKEIYLENNQTEEVSSVETLIINSLKKQAKAKNFVW